MRAHYNIVDFEADDAGLIVITAFISPFCADRVAARAIIGSESFREVYVSTSLAICESRDPKGLYSRARAGVVTEFTGISSPYEPPEQPDLIIDASQLSLGEIVPQLVPWWNEGPRLDNRLGIIIFATAAFLYSGARHAEIFCLSKASHRFSDEFAGVTYLNQVEACLKQDT